MPIISNPSVPNPVPPTTATAPDGILTATVHAAGMILHAVFNDPTVNKINFVRDPEVTVRSGDPAWAPDGDAYAYDHETPLGRPAIWRAYPIRSGVVGTPSQPVSLEWPDLPYGYVNCWVKSITDPELSRKMIAIEPMPEYSREDRSTLQAPAGSIYPAGAWDVHTAWTTSLNFVTQSEDEKIDAEALFTSGPLLLQFARRFLIPDMYVLPGALTMAPHARMDTGAHTWNVAVTEIRRPPTQNSPLIIPGNSYDLLDDRYASYEVVTNSYTSYGSVIESSL